MALENLRGVVRHSSGALSALRLALATGYASHPGARRLVLPLLKALSRDGLLPFRYRKDGRGLSGVLRVGELCADLQGFREIVVEECYRVPMDFRPATVIDGGANLGFFSIHAKTRWPEANVVALEPLPENAALLERHLEANGIDATVLRAGLSARSGTARFQVRDPLRGSLSNAEGPSRGDVDVATRRLSDVFAAHVRGPCLIKLDIEGAELEVLEEFFRVPRRQCVIVGEYHRWPENGDRLDRLFAAARFEARYYSEDASCKLFTATCTG